MCFFKKDAKDVVEEEETVKQCEVDEGLKECNSINKIREAKKEINELLSNYETMHNILLKSTACRGAVMTNFSINEVCYYMKDLNTKAQMEDVSFKEMLSKLGEELDNKVFYTQSRINELEDIVDREEKKLGIY